MARPPAQHAKNRQMIADGTDLQPLGPPPEDVPPRVRHWWRVSAALWPQLSQRDYPAFSDYCHLLVEQESLRKDVRRHGRFYKTAEGVVRESAYYKALVRAEARLIAFRRDFAAPAGYRERAGAVRQPEAGDDIDSL